MAQEYIIATQRQIMSGRIVPRSRPLNAASVSCSVIAPIQFVGKQGLRTFETKVR